MKTIKKITAFLFVALIAFSSIGNLDVFAAQNNAPERGTLQVG